MFDRDIQDDLVARNEMELSRDLIKCDSCDCIFPSGDAIISYAFSDTIERSVLCPTCLFNDVLGDDGDGDDDDHYDDSMDGDHESGLASAGWGTDEDYGDYGDYDDCF